MAYTYVVSYGLSALGPWTQYGNSLSLPSVSVSGLPANKNYWFQLVATDTGTGLTNQPVVFGPVSTS